LSAARQAATISGRSRFSSLRYIAEQLREIDVVPQGLLLDPVGRNTAPAACVAALWLTERDPEALMLLMPSDHAIAILTKLFPVAL
jgi:mannose-1-phosphate guanylyltransferase